VKAQDILKYALLSYFVLYGALALFNLDRIPIAWIDEAYFLDPAIQFLKTGVYSSKIWPQEGTEKFFFAHFPVISLVHIVNLSLFPWEIFYVRLPFFFIFGIGIYFYYRWLRDGWKLSNVWCLIIVCLFINDKFTGEAQRSVRTEAIELMLMSIVFWRISTSKNGLWTVFFLSLMTLTHPKLWGMVVLLFVYVCWDYRKSKELVFFPLVFLLPVLLFLAWGNFDFILLKQQLLPHATEHSTSFGWWNKLYDHFIGRFWPHYKTQPYVPVIFVLSLFFSARSIIKNWLAKENLAEWCFLATNLYWFFVLGPFPRYDPILLFFSYAICGKNLHFFAERWMPSRWGVVCFLIMFPLFSFVFLSRQGAAILQRNERDLSKVLQWYDSFFSKKGDVKILLVDDSSCHYYAINHPNMEYASVFSLHKFHFDEYDEVYTVAWEPIDLAGVRLIGEYLAPHPALLNESSSQQMTYHRLKLYRVLANGAFEHLSK